MNNVCLGPEESTIKVPNIEIIPFLIELEILKLQGKDIKREFGIKDWLEELYYEKHSKLPIYSNLPNELKGRVAE